MVEVKLLYKDRKKAELIIGKRKGNRKKMEGFGDCGKVVVDFACRRLTGEERYFVRTLNKIKMKEFAAEILPV